MYKFVACSESDERRCKRFFLRDFVVRLPSTRSLLLLADWTVQEVSRFLVEQHRVQL